MCCTHNTSSAARAPALFRCMPVALWVNGCVEYRRCALVPSHTRVRYLRRRWTDTAERAGRLTCPSSTFPRTAPSTPSLSPNSCAHDQIWVPALHRRYSFHPSEPLRAVQSRRQHLLPLRYDSVSKCTHVLHTYCTVVGVCLYLVRDGRGGVGVGAGVPFNHAERRSDMARRCGLMKACVGFVCPCTNVYFGSGVNSTKGASSQSEQLNRDL